MAFTLEEEEEIQSCKTVFQGCWRQTQASSPLRASRYFSVSRVFGFVLFFSRDGPAVSQALQAVWLPDISSLVKVQNHPINNYQESIYSIARHQ